MNARNRAAYAGLGGRLELSTVADLNASTLRCMYRHILSFSALLPTPVILRCCGARASVVLSFPPMPIRATLIATLIFCGAACVGPAPESTGRVQQRLDVCAVSPDGALCDDGKICTTPDICKAGVCVGTLMVDGTPCTNGDVCQIRNSQVCKAGTCVGTPAPDGYPCLDDEPCTDPDTCRAGKCIPGPPKVCDDGDTCTTDSCVSGKGCMAVPIPECTHPDAADGRADADGGDAADGSNDLLDAVMPPLDMSPADTPPVDVPVVDVAPRDVADVVSMEMSPADVAKMDMSLPEVADVGGLGDSDDGVTGADVAGDGLAEAQGEVDSDTGDAPIGPTDGPPDPAADGGSDQSDDQAETPPDLHARGGACVCSASEGANPSGTLLLGLLVGIGLGRGRRRSARRPD